MKVLWFVMLVGYAVRCEDNNYYVIQMVEDPPTQKPFKVYWNVPTKQCKSKKIPFDNLHEKFGIIQNRGDHFQGERVTILYDPGLFPALLKNETSGKFRFRNGGVPQEGDLDKHLEAFKYELDQSIPEENFDGVGVIDFESWRPVYRQNFGVLRPYKDVSLEIERNLHWWWQKRWLEAEAKRRFEEGARTFMEATIALAKELRPRAQWGFYGFPYCFNMASNNMQEACAANVPQENDKMSWLWDVSTALYPSVYSSVELSTAQLRALVRGRVGEAARTRRPVLPYFWYRYRDAGFLSQVDLDAALETLYKSNASGIIIWGSSSDVDTVQKCTKLLNYIENVMGPAIAKYTKPQNTLQDGISDINITEIHSIPTINSSNSEAANKTKELDPEYHWIPPENYTQEIENHVAKEIIKKLTNYSAANVHNETVLEKNNLLIDLILNSVLNKVNTASDLETLTTVVHSNAEANNLFSSTTTEVNKLFESETTTKIFSSSDIVLLDTDHTSQKGLIATPSTENIRQVEANNDSNFNKSYENYETDDIYDITLDTTSSYVSSIYNIVTDSSRSKNIKKTLLQDSLEEYFDVTTQRYLITETTDTTKFDMNITETGEEYRNYTTTTNSDKQFTGETTELNAYNNENIPKITTLQDEFDINTVAKISIFTTDAPVSRQNVSQTSTINYQANEMLVNLSTKTTDLIMKSVTEDYTSTKTTNERVTAGLENYLSTEKLNSKANQTRLQENTEAENLSTNDVRETAGLENYLSTEKPKSASNQTSLQENTESENISTNNDDTALTSTSTSPEQVVVYV